MEACMASEVEAENATPPLKVGTKRRRVLSAEERAWRSERAKVRHEAKKGAARGSRGLIGNASGRPEPGAPPLTSRGNGSGETWQTTAPAPRLVLFSLHTPETVKQKKCARMLLCESQGTQRNGGDEIADGDEQAERAAPSSSTSPADGALGGGAVSHPPNVSTEKGQSQRTPLPSPIDIAPAREPTESELRAVSFLREVGNVWTKETFLVMALLQARHGLPANQVGPTIELLSGFLHSDWERIWAVCERQDGTSTRKQPHDARGRDIAQYATLAIGLMVDLQAAKLMGESKWLWIGIDGTSKFSGRSFEEVTIGGVVHDNSSGTEREWHILLTFDEVVASTEKDMLDIIIREFSRLQDYQIQHRWKRSFWSDVKVCVFDNTASHTGCTNSLGALLSEHRTTDWVARGKDERHLSPLIYKGCADHTIALMPKLFQEQVSKYLATSHADMLTNGRIYHNAILQLLRLVYIHFGCGKYKREIKEYVKKYNADNHTDLKIQFCKVTSGRFGSFDLMASRVYRCRGVLLGMIEELITAKSCPPQIQQIKTALEDPRVLFVLRVMSTAASKVLFPSMYRMHRCKIVAEYKRELRQLMKMVDDARACPLEWLLPASHEDMEEILNEDDDESEEDKRRALQEMGEVQRVLEVLGGIGTATVSDSEDEVAEEGDEELDYIAPLAARGTFTAEEATHIVVLYLNSIAEMVKKHDKDFCEGGKFFGRDCDHLPVRCVNRQGERIFAMSDLFLRRQRYTNAPYVSACLKLRSAHARMLRDSWALLQSDGTLFPGIRKIAPGDLHRSRMTRAEYDKMYYSVLLDKISKREVIHKKHREHAELVAPALEWMVRVGFVDEGAKVTNALLRSFLRVLRQPSPDKKTTAGYVEAIENARAVVSPTFVVACVKAHMEQAKR